MPSKYISYASKPTIKGIYYLKELQWTWSLTDNYVQTSNIAGTDSAEYCGYLHVHSYINIDMRETSTEGSGTDFIICQHSYKLGYPNTATHYTETNTFFA